MLTSRACFCHWGGIALPPRKLRAIALAPPQRGGYHGSHLQDLDVMCNRCISDIKAIVARRHDNGGDYWATADRRLAVGDPFSTLTSLLILHELGVGRTHEAVRGAIRLIFDAWRDDGCYRVAQGGALYPCSTAAAARVLCRFGYAKDRRLQRTFAHLLEIQHNDGGWQCAKFPYGRGPETEFSNPGVTLLVLDAFRFTERFNNNPRLDKAVESLLGHLLLCQKGKRSEPGLKTY